MRESLSWEERVDCKRLYKLGVDKVWPEFVGLVVLMLLCFAISYVVFMKQEIRSL